jgi:hypothetical protein
MKDAKWDMSAIRVATALPACFVACFSLYAGVGCSKGRDEASFVGTWTGVLRSVPLPPKYRNDPRFKESTRMLKRSFRLELRQDKTFAIFWWFMPMAGKWNYADGKVTLNVTQVSGSDIKRMQSGKGTFAYYMSQPQVFDVRSEGPYLRLGADRIPFVFTKNLN